MDHFRLERFADSAFSADGVAVGSLEPGTTVVVCTRNSEYRVGGFGRRRWHRSPLTAAAHKLVRVFIATAARRRG